LLLELQIGLSLFWGFLCDLVLHVVSAELGPLLYFVSVFVECFQELVDAVFHLLKVQSLGSQRYFVFIGVLVFETFPAFRNFIETILLGRCIVSRGLLVVFI